jgi:hypothetical protein
MNPVAEKTQGGNKHGGHAMNNRTIGGIVVGVLLLVGLTGWASTAPYLSNQGLGRTPGVIIGGTDTAAPSDFTSLNGGRGPLIMKMSGFPPFVVYLSYAGTPDGVITATRPDGGYWARRVREGTGDGWLRFGDATYAMRAAEVVGDARIPLLEQWSARTGMPMDSPGPEPLRDWEVFVWTPR